jgi:hypothetical protein
LLAIVGLTLGVAMAQAGLSPVNLHGPLHYLGIIDPRCGGTRSVRLAVLGQWADSWRYNPLGLPFMLGAELLLLRAVVGWISCRWLTPMIRWTSRRRRAAWVVSGVLLVLMEINQHAGDVPARVSHRSRLPDTRLTGPSDLATPPAVAIDRLGEPAGGADDACPAKRCSSAAVGRNPCRKSSSAKSSASSLSSRGRTVKVRNSQVPRVWRGMSSNSSSPLGRSTRAISASAVRQSGDVVDGTEFDDGDDARGRVGDLGHVADWRDTAAARRWWSRRSALSITAGSTSRRRRGFAVVLLRGTERVVHRDASDGVELHWLSLLVAEPGWAAKSTASAAQPSRRVSSR